MEEHVTAFVWLLFATGVLTAVFGVLAWRRRTEPGGAALAVYLAGLSVGAFAYALDIWTVDIHRKFLWSGVALVAMAVVAGAWVYLSIEYTGRSHWTGRRTALLLALDPLLVIVALAVPRLNSLLYRLPAEGTRGPMTATGATPGPVLIVNFVYVVVTMLVGTALLVDLFVRARHLYRTQATAILVAAFAPWAGVLLRSLGLFGPFDGSFWVWAISGMALTVALYRFNVLDPVPTAHASVVEDMGDGVVVLDEDDCVGDVNPVAAHLLEADESALVGKPVSDVLDGWGRIETVEPTEWTELSLTVDGDERFVEVQVTSFFDHHDRRIGRFLLLRDVTERERREQALAEYKTVFETVQDRVFVLDGAGRFRLTNDPLASMLGYDRDELIGLSFAELLADPENDWRDSLADDDLTRELTLETADGEIVPCEVHRTPIQFESGRGSVGYVRDISRRKRAERDLERTSGRLETLVEASPLAVVATDADGHVEAWNPAAEEIFGYTADEAVGSPPPIIPDAERDQIMANLDRVLGGERLTGIEVPLERKDGTVIDTSVSIAPQRDASGEIHGTVAVIADVTERKERERKLEQTNDRLEEFASVVSHDLRNPLQVASGNVQMIKEGDVERAEQVESALDRMDSLIEDVLALARHGEDVGEETPIELGPLVDEAWAHVQTGDATLAVAVGGMTIEGHRSRLLELLENLFRNAIEHGRPDITVTVGSIADCHGFYVADDGPGIPESERDDVFETGYTTTEDGTGFGLSIVETVVEAHDWSASITDSESGGARFEFYTGEPITVDG